MAFISIYQTKISKNVLFKYEFNHYQYTIIVGCIYALHYTKRVFALFGAQTFEKITERRNVEQLTGTTPSQN